MGMPPFPGHELEKSLGKTLSAAGTALAGAFDRLLKVWTSRITAESEAAAEEIRADAKFKGDLERAKTLAEEKRRQQLIDAEHQRQLALRGLGRTVSEIARGQQSVEWIAQESIEVLENDPDRNDARTPDDDWLTQFFKYASEVTEQQVLKVLARALADAAIKTRPLISPKTLDTLRFFEPYTYNMFDFGAKYLALFGAVPIGYFEDHHPSAGTDTPFDLQLMVEMGLIALQKQKFLLVDVGDVTLVFTYKNNDRFEFEAITLTHVGKQLAGLIDPAFRALASSTSYNGLTSSHELWKFQKRLGISEQEVGRLTQSLISVMSNTWSIEIQCFAKASEGKKIPIFKTERKTVSDPFRLGPVDFPNSVSEENQSLVRYIIAEFHNFDENQLPYIS